MTEIEIVTAAAATLADELARVTAEAESERRATVAYLRRMADLWGGTSREPGTILRGCATYIEHGGHREAW
jgi:hypothetical protein